MSGDKRPIAAETAHREASHEQPSSDLLARVRRGDRSAVDALVARLFPWLRRRAWGYGGSGPAQPALAILLAVND